MWNNLTLKEKAELIQAGVKAGYRDIDSIKERFNSFSKGNIIEPEQKDQEIKESNTPYSVLPKLKYKKNPKQEFKEKVNKFDDGGFFGKIARYHPKYWGSPKIEGESLKEAIFKAYDEGLEGKNIIYNDRVYRAQLSDEDFKEYGIYKQHNENKNITNEDVVDTYIKNSIYTFENPTHKHKINGKYYPYTDKDKEGKIHHNLGPGIESHSNMGKHLDYSGKTGYSKEHLEKLVREDLLEKMGDINNDLHEMFGEDVDTMSLGNRMILLDIAHNVSPRGKKRGNMPKAWPSLVGAMMLGDSETAIDEMYSGSKRRQNMRSDLLWKNEITPKTVKNR